MIEFIQVQIDTTRIAGQSIAVVSVHSRAIDVQAVRDIGSMVGDSLARLQIRVQGNLDPHGVRKASHEELREHLIGLGFENTELFDAPSMVIEVLPKTLPRTKA